MNGTQQWHCHGQVTFAISQYLIAYHELMIDHFTGKCHVIERKVIPQENFFLIPYSC